MFFQLSEILRWLGLTVFEVFSFSISVLAFTVLLTLKVEASTFGLSPDFVSWWTVYAPLFIADAFNAYFVVIVFIRMSIEGTYKSAVLRSIWSLFFLCMLALFKFMLCKKLSGDANLDYSEVFAPIFIVLQFFFVRACQLH